jgi:general secretion pathway protein A
MPFMAGAKPAFEHPDFESIGSRIAALCSIHASGILHGANGVGKSYLLSTLLEKKLPEKQFKTLVLTHSSLSGSDLLRALCLLQNLTPRFRRSDNVAQITQGWNGSDNRWPILVVEEAQNLSSVALEELRLLCCVKLDKVPFSLLLVGDNSLLAKLQLGVHAPLRSRLGYSLKLSAFNAEQSRQYIQHGLRSASIHSDPLEADALELLVQSGGGLPRTINHLVQRCLEAAARERSATVTSSHVQSATDQLPWLASLLREQNGG